MKHYFQIEQVNKIFKRGSQETNVLKEAELENGMGILVPQFVRVGDLVRVDVESGKYLDRVR